LEETEDRGPGFALNQKRFRATQGRQINTVREETAGSPRNSRNCTRYKYVLQKNIWAKNQIIVIRGRF